MSQIFTKAVGAPLGTFKYSLANRTYLINDTSPTDSITVTNFDDIVFFAHQPELTFTGTSGSYSPPPNYMHPERLFYAAALDPLLVGAVTRDVHGAPLSGSVVWPDGTAGTYVAAQVSTTFAGSIDAYVVTYGSPAIETYTQPVMTRDGVSGAVTNRPGILLS